jgi:hypothetical protein
MLMDDVVILRRKAVSAMAAAIAETSPAQAAIRDAGRRHSQLVRRLLELHMAGEDTASINDELVACTERLIELVDLIEVAWGALFDARQGPMP